MANEMDGDLEPHVVGSTLLVRVYIPDAKTQKCLVVNPHETVWAAKQVILEKLNQELPKDPLNYSLYVPPSGDGRRGRYLEDHRLLAHYALPGHVPKLEMKYKSRDYSVRGSLSEKAIAKANSKANQRKLLEYVTSGSMKKVEKLLESGLDPNFVTDDGNTPLGLACGRTGRVQCVVPLLSAGAHIDFRGKDALTALHRAAIGGNEKATKILLSYGASPNYRDAKGLTPLYHTAIMGDDTGTSLALLRYRAEMGIRDAGGWTELHQTSKYGHKRHADLFILYGADINAQNIVGNTPLHVAASHEASECAMLLLKRGADKMKINYSSQTPGQVAILCGHHQLSSEITNFSPEQMERHTDIPDFDPNARKFDSKLFVERTVSETCPLTPPAESLVGTLTQEWEEKDPLDSYSAATMKATIPAAPGFPIISTVSIGSRGSVETESCSSVDQDSTHSGSTTGTPYQCSPAAQPRSGLSTFQHQRERLYRAGPGMYVAVEDVEPLQPGDLPLWRGMPVEVVYIGKGGYWEGKAGGKQGWFPALAIQELTEEECDTPDLSQEELDKMEEPTATTFERRSNIKDIIIVRGSKGYGFAMRGVKATKAMKFQPSPNVPALQYVGNVDQGGCADLAGLKTGDFIIEVNGYNVTYSTHDEVVNIVKKSGGTLILKVITPNIRARSTSTQIRDHLVPGSTPDTLMRSGSSESQLESSKKQSRSLQSLEETSRRRGSFSSERRGSFDKPRPTTPNPSGYYRGSPVLRRIERSGWDSSQGEDLDNSPTSSRRSRSAYHIPIAQQSSQRSGVTMYPILQDEPEDEYPSSPESEPYNKQETLQQQSTKRTGVPRYKSATLPRLPTKDYPTVKETVHVTDLSGVPELSSSEEELKEAEEVVKKAVSQSAFTRAIQERKEKIERLSRLDSIQRTRSQTMPEPPKRTVSVLMKREGPKRKEKEDTPPYPKEEEQGEGLSQLEQEIRQASVSRTRRLSLHQPRMTDLLKKDNGIISNQLLDNPIASAVMRKIDSVMLNDEDVHSSSGDDFDSSPKFQPISHSRRPLGEKAKPTPKPKPPPPVVKPKPLRKSKTFDFGIDTTPTDPPRENDEGSPERPASPWNVQLRKTPTSERKFKPKASTNMADESSPETPTSPWNVSLRKTPTSERKFKQPRDLELEQEEDGAVNWKSILKPAGDEPTTPRSSDYEDARGSTRQQRPLSPAADSQKEPVVAKAFETQSPTRDTRLKSRHDESHSPRGTVPPQSSTEGISLFDDAPVTSMPSGYTLPSGESFDDTYWAEPGGGSTELLPPPILEVGGESFDFSADDLPPPLPLSHSSSIDHGSLTTDALMGSIPPPVEFVTLEDADVGETDTDDIILPPPIMEEELPPPLPPLETFPGTRPLGSLETLTDFVNSHLPPTPSTREKGALAELDNESSHNVSSDSDIPPPPPSTEPPPLDFSPNEDTFGLIPPATSPVLEEVDTPFESSQLTEELVSNIPLPVATTMSPPNSPSSGAYHRGGEEELAPPRPPPPADDRLVAPKGSSSVSPESLASPTPGFTKDEPQKEQEAKPGYSQKSVKDWDIDDVCGWLQGVGLGEHCEQFVENEIVGEHLIDLTKDDLKELGVKKLGHQKTILSKLSQIAK